VVRELAVARKKVVVGKRWATVVVPALIFLAQLVSWVPGRHHNHGGSFDGLFCFYLR
jgi:hypothetical protein